MSGTGNPPRTAVKRELLIVGAGLAGSLAAIALAQRGYRVAVYERRRDPRGGGFMGGRSINLALSTRGISALRSVGLADEILTNVVPMRGRMMHAVSGELVFQPYSSDRQQAINSVSRGGLNITLLETADSHDNVSLHFNMRCEHIDLEQGVACFRTASDETQTVEADLIIGADGAYSAVRDALRITDRFDYSQTYLAHGYKEMHIPPTGTGDFAMEPHALHIWPRGGFMMIALPNEDKSFTCTLFWPLQGANCFDMLDTPEAVTAFFEQHFADAVPLMPTLIDDYMNNPVSSLVTVRCSPWQHEDRVVLIGDASHAIVPFYGQGMNAAFEDVEILAQMIDTQIDESGQGDWGALLYEFSRRRKPNSDAIADMAVDNFLEMRDHVGSAAFLWGKRVEKALHRLMPQSFTPLYEMVTFSTIPYAVAREQSRRQKRMLWGAGFAVAFTLFIVGLIALGLLQRS